MQIEKELLAPCGLYCGVCGIRIAHRDDNEKFKARLTTFRSWMTRAGESGKPLFLTEYGVLYGNGCCECPLIAAAETIAFMQDTTRWLAQSRTTQAWAWFAVRTGGRFNGDLFDERGALTQSGLAYRELGQIPTCRVFLQCE